MHSSQQIQLYGLDKYFNEIAKLYALKKMPNKILLTGKKGTGKSTIAYHLINYILSYSEENKYDNKNFTINKNNRSFILMKNYSHPNFYLIDLIDGKKNIEIDQIRKMINYTNKSSFNLTPRLILIDNIENLNRSSTNALLKIIEEPNENIFFILIHNSNKVIMATLKSRCLTYNICLSFNQTIDIVNLIIKDSLFNLINKDLINYYNSTGDIINLINFSKDKKIDLKDFTLTSFLFFLIDNNHYKKNIFIKNLLLSYIELYFLKTYKLSDTKNDIMNAYHNFMIKIKNSKNYNLDDESLFMEFKSKLLNA